MPLAELTDEEMYEIRDFWPQFLKKFEAIPFTGRLYKDSWIAGQDGGRLHIGIPKDLADQFDKISAPRTISALERFLIDQFNRRIPVDVALMDPLEGVEEEVAEAEVEPEERGDGADIREDPVVRKALEIFNGDIIEVREIKGA